MRIWKYIRQPKTVIWFEYSLLALIVLGGILLPGYVLTLDLVFSPHMQWPQEVTNTFPLQVVLWTFGQFLPGDVVQKIVLFAILLLSGVGTHLVIKSIQNYYTDWRLSWTWAAYFAGVFYMINPFTYSRFMAGQWMVLLGYALFPFFVRSVILLFQQQKIAQAAKVGLWATLTVVASIHFVGMIALVFIGSFTIATIKRYRTLCSMLALALGGVLLLSSYWLIPAVFGGGSIGTAANGFDASHFDGFATNGRGALGSIGEVIRLQGFWVESRGFYTLPQEKMPLWGLLFMAIWALVVLGAIAAGKRSKVLAFGLLGCVLAGVVLAATPLIAVLKDSLPFIAGYREPHKFAALIAFGYAILGGLGAGYIGTKIKRGRMVVAVGVIALPLLITPVMLFGFGGQLKTVQYPKPWFELNRMLKRSVHSNEKVLFLPWHQYGKYSFTDRIIANPSEVFFEVPVISSDNPEYKDVPPTTHNQEKRNLEQALGRRDIKQVLVDSNISHVVVLKEQDYENYYFLGDTAGLTKSTENESYIVYSRQEEDQ